MLSSGDHLGVHLAFGKQALYHNPSHFPRDRDMGGSAVDLPQWSMGQDIDFVPWAELSSCSLPADAEEGPETASEDKPRTTIGL